MKTQRITIAGLLVTVASLAIVGCGTKAGTTSASSSPTPLSPKDALIASVKVFDSNSYTVTVTQPGTTIKAKADMTNKVAGMTFDFKSSTVSMKQDWVLTESDTWIKMDLGGASLNKQFGVQPTKWMHVDKSKLKSVPPVVFGANGDPLGVAGFDSALVTVERVDATHFSGTLDASKLANIEEPDADALKKAGDKAKSLPFTATIDGQGRLAEFKIDKNTAAPALAIDVAVIDIGGAASTATKPTTNIIQMPNSVYTMLNG
jgi:hypothetical protein